VAGGGAIKFPARSCCIHFRKRLLTPLTVLFCPNNFNPVYFIAIYANMCSNVCNYKIVLRPFLGATYFLKFAMENCRSPYSSLALSRPDLAGGRPWAVA